MRVYNESTLFPNKYSYINVELDEYIDGVREVVIKLIIDFSAFSLIDKIRYFISPKKFSYLTEIHGKQVYEMFKKIAEYLNEGYDHSSPVYKKFGYIMPYAPVYCLVSDMVNDLVGVIYDHGGYTADRLEVSVMHNVDHGTRAWVDFHKSEYDNRFKRRWVFKDNVVYCYLHFFDPTPFIEAIK